MSTDLFRALVSGAAGVVERLATVGRDAASLRAIGSRLGWNLTTELAPIMALAAQARTVALMAQSVGDASAEADWLALAGSIADVHDAIVGLESTAFGAELDSAGFAGEFSAQLLQWAVIDYLDQERPVLAGALRAAGFVMSVARPAEGIRLAYEDTRFAEPDFGALFESPSAWLRTAWAWAAPTFRSDAMLDRLAEMCGQLGIAAGFVRVAPQAGEVASSPPGAMRMHLIARLVRGFLPAGDVELGLEVAAFEDAGGPVVAIVPYALGALAAGVSVGDLYLVVNGLASAGERGLVVRPDGVQVSDDPLSTGAAPVHTSLTVSLSREAGPAESVTHGPTNVTTRGWQVIAGGKGALAGGSELWIELKLPNLTVGLPEAGSGFVASAMGRAPRQVPAPLTVGLSSTRGLYLGATGLVLDRATSLRLGALEVQRVLLALSGGERGVVSEMRTDLAMAVGPVQLVAEGLGVALSVGFPRRGGNVGPVDLGAALLAPTGFGVAIDTALVRGAGEVARLGAVEYRGALALEVQGFAINGIGVLNDAPGVRSLAAVIAASFRPIPLPLGFTLQGVGGLIGIHRRIDTDALRAALRTPAGMGDVFFPADPIAQAGRLTTDLARYFPAAEGRYVFGPAVKFGWGAPTVVRGRWRCSWSCRRRRGWWCWGR
ncbi:MAG: hypothetical protein IPL61_36390 [Myxococcales bacterium]|nr:hypothetical protein [Myxococcales bacterium]